MWLETRPILQISRSGSMVWTDGYERTMILSHPYFPMKPLISREISWKKPARGQSDVIQGCMGQKHHRKYLQRLVGETKQDGQTQPSCSQVVRGRANQGTIGPPTRCYPHATENASTWWRSGTSARSHIKASAKQKARCRFHFSRKR